MPDAMDRVQQHNDDHAEDALRRRKDWRGSREVRFDLSESALRIVHCGRPFTLGDVKGVCGIKENYEKEGPGRTNMAYGFVAKKA